MAQYMIHAVPSRMWYVHDYLIPSMRKQGIAGTDIDVYCDTQHEGNLRSCMKAFGRVSDKVGGTWHLQDDVVICSDFKDRTEQYDSGIVCGFASKYDEETPAGTVDIGNLWFSFPCIRIPNNIALACSRWCLELMIGNPVYREYWENGANDDWFFRQFIWNRWDGEIPSVLNLAPNLVDHIDYLIGGTVNSNTTRTVIIRSTHWEDEQSVKDLEEWLSKRHNM